MRFHLIELGSHKNTRTEPRLTDKEKANLLAARGSTR